MAVSKTGNLAPVDDLLYAARASAPVADKQLINPSNLLCYYDGEWIKISSTGKVERATTITTLGNANTAALVHPVMSERGSTDVQASPDGHISYLIGPYGHRWTTSVYDATVSIGSGTTITGAYGQPLKVATIALVTPQGSRNLSGLVGHGGSGDTDPIVGRVVEVRNGRLEFVLTSPLSSPR